MGHVKSRLAVNSRWVVATIRVMMVILFTLYLTVILLSWATALFGDLEQLTDWLDYDVAEQPATWRLVVGFTLDLLPVASFAAVFWSVHRFFSLFGRDQYFDFPTISTIYRLGWALISVWITIFFSELMMLFLVEPADPEDRFSLIDLLPIDTEAIFLFLGLVFVAMAGILDEARLLDEESKEII